MPDARFDMVMSRLEAALARLERIAPSPAQAEELVALAERHLRLRAGTVDALTRLDRLIGDVAPGAD